MSRWQPPWQALGARDEGAAVCSALLAAWGEPQRHYHSRQHLGECLDWADALRATEDVVPEVELALWFHDAVYDPTRADNEARSADWAREAMQAAGIAASQIEAVCALIMATCHAAEAAHPHAPVLLDIDLAILGAPAQRFDEYEQQVRREYAFVPDALFREKRAEILRGFLARPQLYLTRTMQDRLEAQARDNLRRSLS